MFVSNLTFHPLFSVHTIKPMSVIKYQSMINMNGDPDIDEIPYQDISYISPRPQIKKDVQKSKVTVVQIHYDYYI